MPEDLGNNRGQQAWFQAAVGSVGSAQNSPRPPHEPMAALTRSGRNGAWRKRPPIASKSTRPPLVPPPPGKLYAWLVLHSDNTATLFTEKVETETGVQTALAQIAAEELDFPFCSAL